MKRTMAACGLVVVAAVALATGASGTGLVVHEWGTFLAMHGSDGIALDGMYHEEHALPGFVHARSREELSLPAANMKGETPVVYFYADAPSRVWVEVGFPNGLWTHWYPQAEWVGPKLVQFNSPDRARNGLIRWTVDVEPPSRGKPSLPVTDPEALWNYTRDVDAAYVTAADSTRGGARESERFIFYRGLGQASLPINVTTEDGARQIRMSCASDLTESLRHIYVIRVENGRGTFSYLPSLRCGKTVRSIVPPTDTGHDVDRFAHVIADDLAARLVETGLYAKEARAMVNTWRTSYFETDGIRVLFVLPQSWTDRFIPMRVQPQPRELVRTMVGRIELLTPERERAAEEAISGLASPDPAVREAAFGVLRNEGRYVEPILRRTLQTSQDQEVLTLCRRLLMTDFVNDIRTSLNDAADGRKVAQEPAYSRAQLASLLREIGLHGEAKQEGELALAALTRMPRPTMTDHRSRHTFRALARAYEGTGDDAAAFEAYGAFVEFGTGFASRSCSGCHQAEGPRDASFFREWWAGRKFAELARNTGQTARLIQVEETTLANHPDSLLSQIRLAYLYEARGDFAAAGRLWELIDPGSESNVARTISTPR